MSPRSCDVTNRRVRAGSVVMSQRSSSEKNQLDDQEPTSRFPWRWTPFTSQRHMTDRWTPRNTWSTRQVTLRVVVEAELYRFTWHFNTMKWHVKRFHGVLWCHDDTLTTRRKQTSKIRKKQTALRKNTKNNPTSHFGETFTAFSSSLELSQPSASLIGCTVVTSEWCHHQVCFFCSS